MEENTNVTTTKIVDNNGTAAGTQQMQDNDVTLTRDPKPVEKPMEPAKTVSFGEHQKAMTGQYKAGIAAAMKEAGFEPDRGEDFKAQMAAFRAWQDSQKTEAQKAAEALEAANGNLKAKDDEIANLNFKVAALGKGIPADKLDDYIRLASGYAGEDYGEKLDAVLQKFPIAKPDAPAPYAAGTGTSPMMGQNDALKTALGMK